MKNFLIFKFFLLINLTAFAQNTFKAGYLELDLLNKWTCDREELDWVCHPKNINERSEAIVVIVNKNKDEVDDKLEIYEEILKEARNMRDLNGDSYDSVVKYIRRTSLGGIEWVDALHLGSEIPGFYTRYLVSTHENMAVLFSAHIAENAYKKHSATLAKIAGSLSLSFDQNYYDQNLSLPKSSLLGKRSSSKRSLPGQVLDFGKKAKAKIKGNFLEKNSRNIVIAIIVAIGLFLFIRKRRGY